MVYRKVGFIINPSSGVQNLSVSRLKELLEGAPFEWDIQLTRTKGDISKLVRYFQGIKVGVIAVYGGDGTVVEVAKALKGGSTPLLLLHGGTANILAKELKISPNIEETLKLLKEDRLEVKSIDTGECNGRFFLIRINIGILADIVENTKRKYKKVLGQSAYLLTALKESVTPEASIYRVTIDGKRMVLRGAGLVVANSGNIGAEDLSLAADCTVDDSHLDAILIENTSPRAIAAFLKNAVAQKNSKGVIHRFKVKKSLTVTVPPRQTVVIDDEVTKARRLIIAVKPRSLQVLVPRPRKEHVAREVFMQARSLLTYAVINIQRFADHLIRYITGLPTLQRSAVTPNLYVGGQYRLRSLSGLSRLGITAIVNMRTRSVHKAAQVEGFKYLHLPTVDRHAPTMEHIQKGVEFITTEIKNGGRVYAHCRFGEGRGVTIAVAYLISTGLTYDDGLALIRKVRTFAKPTVAQRARLIEYEQSLKRKPKT